MTKQTKIEKAHIALLTNVTEGRVKNEHVTLQFFKSATAETIAHAMREANMFTPIRLAALQTEPSAFTSFSGEQIQSILVMKYHDKQSEGLFYRTAMPHITLHKGPGAPHWNFSELNWDDGLIVGEAHVGFKIDGEMKYFTEDEFAEYAGLVREPHVV